MNTPKNSIVKHIKAPKATKAPKAPKAPKANIKVKANIVVDGNDEDVHTTTIHINGDNDWETLIEDLVTTLAEMGDS